MNWKDAKLLAACVLLCQAAGVIGSFFTFSAIPTWYAELAKPSFNPPNWVFAPAWITLYALMGAALFLVWREKTKLKNKDRKKAAEINFALVVFGVQLALNALWSILFFGFKEPELAFFEIIALWISIAATIFYFQRISKRAALLLAPYILWVSFAATLNFYVWTLNP